MKKFHVNTKDTSHRELCAIAKQLGFVFFEGGKHTKVNTREGVFVTMIPRHETINPFTAKAIVKSLNAHGGEVDFT